MVPRGSLASPLFVGGLFVYLMVKGVGMMELSGPVAIAAMVVGGACVTGIIAVWVWSVRLSRMQPR